MKTRTQMIEVMNPAVKRVARYIAAFAFLALISATGLAQSAERAGRSSRHFKTGHSTGGHTGHPAVPTSPSPDKK